MWGWEKDDVRMDWERSKIKFIEILEMYNGKFEVRFCLKGVFRLVYKI